MNTNFKDWASAIKNNDLSNQDKSALIHPSGYKDNDYFNSGLNDAMHIIDRCSLNENDKILEYGCGNGRIMRHLLNYNISGVDIVPDFVKVARDYKCRSFLLTDCNETFNKIFSLTVFIHLTRKQAETALKYIYSHLQDEGTAYIQFLNYGFNKEGNKFIELNYYDTEELNNLVKKCGFKITKLIKMKGDIHKAEWAINHNELCELKKEAVLKKA